MDHIYTAYRILGWPVPARPNQPLIDLKKRNSLGKGTTKGAYSINHIGENDIAKGAAA